MFKLVKGSMSALIILSIMFFIAYWMNQQGTTDNKNNIKFIQAKTYNGKLIDMQNEVSVKSIKDIKWYYSKRKTITIEYGKILLKYKIKEFITEEVQTDLNSIFITTKQNSETFKLSLFFQAIEIPEYVIK